jgi:hypothetical protein
MFLKDKVIGDSSRLNWGFGIEVFLKRMIFSKEESEDEVNDVCDNAFLINFFTCRACIYIEDIVIHISRVEHEIPSKEIRFGEYFSLCFGLSFNLKSSIIT